MSGEKKLTPRPGMAQRQNHPKGNCSPRAVGVSCRFVVAVDAYIQTEGACRNSKSLGIERATPSKMKR
jgi:hypothetical protein